MWDELAFAFWSALSEQVGFCAQRRVTVRHYLLADWLLYWFPLLWLLVIRKAT